MSPRTLHLAGIAADADTMTETEVYFETPEWRALIGWLEFHGIDAATIPAGTRISRDACGRCIRYVAIVCDDQGKRLRDEDDHDRPWVTVPMVEQGEAAPLPYPGLIATRLHPVRPAPPAPGGATA